MTWLSLTQSFNHLPPKRRKEINKFLENLTIDDRQCIKNKFKIIAQ